MSDIFDDMGTWSEFPQKGDPIYDIRAMFHYCKENGIDYKAIGEVPPEIRDRFIVGYQSY